MKKITAGFVSLLIIINLFVPVHAGQASNDTPDTPQATEWQAGNISDINNLNRVTCFQNKLFVAVGAGGTIRTSKDGQNWTENINNADDNACELYDVVCTDDQIIAVGEKGTVLRSEDGIQWTRIKRVTTSSIVKIIPGKSLFLAFTDKPGEVLVSKNGTAWTAGKITSKQYICDALWNGKVFVTVGLNGEISTSQDGHNWQTKVLKNKPSFNKVAWNGRMFIAFGTTSASTNNYDYTSGLYIASSKDGYSWNIKTIKTKSLSKKSLEIYSCYCENIIWNGKSFIMILNEQTGQPPAVDSMMVTYTSGNGLDWKRNAANIGGDNFVTVWTGNDFTAICNYWSLPGYYYRYDIYKSKDGVSWNKALEENKEDKKINAICCSNGRTVIAGDGGEIRYSEDGISWSRDNVIHIPQVWDGNRFLSIDTKTYNVYSSIDGLTWKKERGIDWNITYGNIFWSGKEYITFGPNYYISTSGDLIKWNKTEYDYAGGLYNDIGSISAFASDGNKYVLAGNKGTAVSSDMKNWVSRKAANYYKAVIIGNDSFVALNIYGQMDISYDGLKWKRLKIKDYNNSINKIIYAKGKFVGVGTNGEVWYSEDGAAWTKAECPAGKTLNAVCWTGIEFIAAGNEGTVITSADGVKWQQEESPVKLNFSNICTNGEIVIINSPEGVIYKVLKNGTGVSGDKTPVPMEGEL